MAGSLADILTAVQNITKGIASAAHDVYLDVQGQQNATDMTAATLVLGTAGRLARVSVTATGATAGAIYDSTNVTTPTRKIYTIPATVGIYEVNFPVAYGIVVVPGAGQTISVSYS